MSGQRGTSTRSKLLATVGVFCLVGLASIGIYAATSRTTIQGVPASDGVELGNDCLRYAQPPLSSDFWDFDRGTGTLDQQDADRLWEERYDDGNADLLPYWSPSFVRPGEKPDCLERSPSEVVGRYPAQPDKTKYKSEAIIAMLVALGAFALLAVGGVLIWTRKDGETADGSTIDDRRATPATESPRASDPVDATVPAGTDAADALRQLKALHDEGILTDDEYRYKRQALADEL